MWWAAVPVPRLAPWSDAKPMLWCIISPEGSQAAGLPLCFPPQGIACRSSPKCSFSVVAVPRSPRCSRPLDGGVAAHPPLLFGGMHDEPAALDKGEEAVRHSDILSGHPSQPRFPHGPLGVVAMPCSFAQHHKCPAESRAALPLSSKVLS